MTSSIARLEEQLAVSANHDAIFLQLACRVLWDEGLNSRAADARAALGNEVPPSFDALLERIEAAGSPFGLGRLGPGFVVDRAKQARNLRPFLSVLLRTLSTCDLGQGRGEAGEADGASEPWADPGRELGILSESVVGDWDAIGDEQPLYIDEITLRVVEDARAALEHVTAKASQRALYVLVGHVMELAGLSSRADSDDPDHARDERTRRYVRTARRRQRPVAPA